MSDLLKPVKQEMVKETKVEKEEVQPKKETVKQEKVEKETSSSIELEGKKNAKKILEEKDEDDIIPMGLSELPEGLQELAKLTEETLAMEETSSFEQLEEKMESEIDPRELLKDIKVDLTSIQISDESMFGLKRTENMFINKKLTQVVACQSAYKAFMSALNNQEIQNITGSDEDYYSYRKRLTKIIFNHTEDTSIGKLDYPEWSKVTSFYDIETLLYGIYCQTFPYENKYNLTCIDPKCRHQFSTVANNNTLVEVRGKDGIFEQVNSIINEVKSPQDAIEKSLVQKVKRIVCEESKIIADVRIPSVHDYLEGIMSKVDAKFAEEYSTSLSIALFIKKLYIPDLVTLKEKGTLSFFEIEDPKKIVKYIAALSLMDAEQLSSEIFDFTEKYQVTYSLKKVQCPSCGRVIEDIPMDMEDLLFQTIGSIRESKRRKK